jgi:hypothetical protein
VRSPFGEFDASVLGWIEHARHADTRGARRHVLVQLLLDGRLGARALARPRPKVAGACHGRPLEARQDERDCARIRCIADLPA